MFFQRKKYNYIKKTAKKKKKKNYAPIYPHDPIVEIFENIYDNDYEFIEKIAKTNKIFETQTRFKFQIKLFSKLKIKLHFYQPNKTLTAFSFLIHIEFNLKNFNLFLFNAN